MAGPLPLQTRSTIGSYRSFSLSVKGPNAPATVEAKHLVQKYRRYIPGAKFSRTCRTHIVQCKTPGRLHHEKHIYINHDQYRSTFRHSTELRRGADRAAKRLE